MCVGLWVAFEAVYHAHITTWVCQVGDPHGDEWWIWFLSSWELCQSSLLCQNDRISTHKCLQNNPTVLHNRDWIHKLRSHFWRLMVSSILYQEKELMAHQGFILLYQTNLVQNRPKLLSSRLIILALGFLPISHYLPSIQVFASIYLMSLLLRQSSIQDTEGRQGQLVSESIWVLCLIFGVLQ